MNYLTRRSYIVLLVGVGYVFVTSLGEYGDVAELIGSILYGVILALAVYFLVGGNMDMLKNNTDAKGKRYSWKNTILGILTFIISIPLVIWLCLYLYGYVGV